MNIDFDDSENVVNQTVSLSVAMLLMWTRLSVRGHTFVFALISLFVMLTAVGEEVTVGVIQLSVQLLPSPFSTHCANSGLISVSFATNPFHFAKCQWWHHCSVRNFQRPYKDWWIKYKYCNRSQGHAPGMLSLMISGYIFAPFFTYIFKGVSSFIKIPNAIKKTKDNTKKIVDYIECTLIN